MKFYNLDQHISVNSDVQYIFKKLGHELDIDSISGHSWVIGRERKHIPLVENNIGSIIQKELWSEYYRQNPQFEDYDGFVVTYPPIFAMLYAKYRKPIILHIPIRYDYPYTDDDVSIGTFNRFLSRNNVIVCANNMLDKKYFEARTKTNCIYIPSVCEYTGMKWNPTREEFLIYDGSRLVQMENVVNRHDMNNHKWSDIERFKGIIHFPYQFSTMSFFEQYTAGIPLFYPSKRFLMNLYRSGFPVLDQCFWTRTQHDGYGYETMGDHLQYADYYNVEMFPHVIQFDGLAELEEKMYDDKFLQWTHEAMIADNKKNQKMVYDSWYSILEALSKK